jgi:hypothetical protein
MVRNHTIFDVPDDRRGALTSPKVARRTAHTAIDETGPEWGASDTKQNRVFTPSDATEIDPLNSAPKVHARTSDPDPRG